MKRSSLFCAGWWPFLLLPILFMAPLLFFKWHSIEAVVASNTNSALKDADAEWAKVETMNRGRHVLLTGTPPNDQSIELAKDAAEGAFGVAQVTISADVVPPAIPASLKTSLADNKITLEGQLASQDAIDLTVDQARASFGNGNVVNKLAIGDNTAELPPMAGFFSTLKDKTNTPNMVANIADNALVLSGEVSNIEVKRELGSELSRLFKGSIDNQLGIAVRKPTKREICQGLVSDLLRTGKINFESAKAVITPDSFALLEKIKVTAQDCSETRFEVAGHTDSVGSLNFNMALSEKRAQAVVDHLVGLGLDATQFSAAGYGPNKPIADNGTPEGRAKNRRIEFKLKN